MTASWLVRRVATTCKRLLSPSIPRLSDTVCQNTPPCSAHPIISAYFLPATSTVLTNKLRRGPRPHGIPRPETLSVWRLRASINWTPPPSPRYVSISLLDNEYTPIDSFLCSLLKC